MTHSRFAFLGTQVALAVTPRMVVSEREFSSWPRTYQAGDTRIMTHRLSEIIAANGACVADQLTGGAACVTDRNTERATDTTVGPVTSGATVLASEAAQTYLADSEVSHVIPFKPSSRLDEAAGDAGVVIAAADWMLVRRLENKLQLPAIAAEAGIDHPATTLFSDVDSIDFPGVPVVVQAAQGYAGEGTWLVSGAGELPTTVRSGKVTQYIHGTTYTVTGVAMDDETVLATTPAIQLTGLPAVTTHPLGSCGNVYRSSLDRELSDSLTEAACSVGRVLASRGFRGAYGVDFQVTPDGDIYLIEVNPRLTQSVGLVTQMHHRPGLPDVFDLHMHAYEHGESGLSSDDARQIMDGWKAARFGRTDVSVLVFRNTGDDPVVASGLACGTVTVDEGPQDPAPRPSLDIDELEPDEAVCMPAVDTGSVMPGGFIGRVIVRADLARDPQQKERRIESIRRAFLGTSS